MKPSERIPKAIAIIFFMGVGLAYNMKEKAIFEEPIRNITGETETIPANSEKATNEENTLFVLTRTVIISGIKHLITNI